MRIVVAIDSFKGSLTSLQAGKAIKEGITRVLSDAEVKVVPIADGGEGTVTALVEGLGGKLIHTDVEGPLQDKVTAEWGLVNNTAIIEMASAAGITLIPRESLNPLYTSTYGVGKLIREAIGRGAREFIVGIGGSSTNDGGVGMLEALGFEFKDEEGNEIPRGAIGLSRLHIINDTNVIPELKECTFKIVCDVQNPLCGPNGCSAIYGPQKGATKSMIEDMDKWLAKYALISSGNPDEPGAGAAGGMGYAFKTFTNSTLARGIDIIIEETGLPSIIEDSDLVITGEGRMDSQTIMGKVPVGIARIAKKYDKKVIAFCGCATQDSGICNSHGIDAIFPILREVTTLDEALDVTSAARNLEATAEQVARLIKLYSVL